MSNLFTLGEFRVDRVEEMSVRFFTPSFLPDLPEDAIAREAHWRIPKHFETYGSQVPELGQRSRSAN